MLFSAALALLPTTSSGWEFHQQGSDYYYGIKGFGTLGGVASDSDKLGFKRNVLQEEMVTKDSPQLLTDSRFGLQMGMRYKNKLQGALQFQANQNTKEVDDFINLAYLQLNVSPQLSIRAGRLPLDVCLLSENRDVGYSYLWSRPVPEFYGHFFLNSFNGFDISYKLRTEIGFFELRAATGTFDTTIPYDYGRDLDAEFRSFWNTNLSYERGFCQLRLFYMNGTIDKVSDSFGNFTAQLETIPADQFMLLRPYFEEFYVVEGSTVEHIAGGIKCSNDKWILQSEIGRLQFEKGMGLTFDSAYISAGYRFNAITPYAVVAWLKSNTDKLPAGALSAASPVVMQHAMSTLNGAINSLKAKQTTFSLGVRWDCYENTALKVQWNHHKITEGGSYLWDNNFASIEDEEVNTFSLSLDFVF